MRRLAIPVLVVLGFCLAACGDSSDEAETIHGTWSLPQFEAYETIESDGTWSVHEGDEPPHAWGTYTLEDGILTMNNADDAYCPGSAVVYEVTFSADGNELHEKIVSETCTMQAFRARDRVLTRYTP